MMYVLDGQTSVAYESDDIHLSTGAFAIFPAALSYTGTPTFSVETITLYIRPEFIASQLPWIPHSSAFFEGLLGADKPTRLPVPASIQERLHNFLIDLSDTVVTSQNELRWFAALTGLFSLLHFGSATHFHSTIRSGNTAVHAAIKLLYKDLSRDWRVTTLAKSVSMSPSQLTRQFVEQTGMPPHRFLRHARANRMNRLLTDGMNVSEAARAVGWKSISHASRVHTAVIGWLPSLEVGRRRRS